MPISFCPPPGQGPEIAFLKRWSIREIDGGGRYLIGWCVANRDGRVSTEIVELDIVARRARTKSGRRYVLVGPSGYDKDASNLWNQVVKVLSRGQPWKDVTEKLVPGSRAPFRLETLSNADDDHEEAYPHNNQK